MNTEKMIPIDFSRNITPYVPGDVYYNNFLKFELTMDQQDADEFNNADPESEFNTYFIVSFADRPNTTGKQPVDGEVVVDCITYNAVITRQIVNQAGTLVWNDECNTVIKSWKPNHAAMLAKFKEQGANTMYTGKKAEEATHIIGLYFKKIIPGNMPEFLDNDGVWQLSSFSVESALNHKSLTELSRPIGERKEDHTIDGILKKAQPQGAKAQAVALTIESLDDNPDEQVIEPWVGDHITDKPVFTQEAHKAGKLPPILSKCEFNYQEDSRWPTGVVVAYYGNGVVIVDDHDVPFVKYQHELRPIDNRSDEERLRDAVWESTELRARDGAAGVVSRLLSSDKFTITLNK